MSVEETELAIAVHRNLYTCPGVFYSATWYSSSYPSLCRWPLSSCSSSRCGGISGRCSWGPWGPETPAPRPTCKACTLCLPSSCFMQFSFCPLPCKFLFFGCRQKMWSLWLPTFSQWLSLHAIRTSWLSEPRSWDRFLCLCYGLWNVVSKIKDAHFFLPCREPYSGGKSVHEKALYVKYFSSSVPPVR